MFCLFLLFRRCFIQGLHLKRSCERLEDLNVYQMLLIVFQCYFFLKLSFLLDLFFVTWNLSIYIQKAVTVVHKIIIVVTYDVIQVLVHIYHCVPHKQLQRFSERKRMTPYVQQIFLWTPFVMPLNFFLLKKCHVLLWLCCMEGLKCAALLVFLTSHFMGCLCIILWYIITI